MEEDIKMHSMCVDPEPGGWILDTYVFFSFVNSMLLLSGICCKVKTRFYSAMRDLCEVPITGWCGGLQSIYARL